MKGRNVNESERESAKGGRSHGPGRLDVKSRRGPFFAKRMTGSEVCAHLLLDWYRFLRS